MVSSINYKLSSYLDCFEDGYYNVDSQLDKLEDIDEAELCQQKCQENPDCGFWYNNFDTKKCYLLKEGVSQTESESCSPGNCNRGPRFCPQGKLNLNRIQFKLSHIEVYKN